MDTNVNLVVAFAFGALSFLSPCVLPLIPGYLAMISGTSIADLSEGRAPLRKVAIGTGLFILGFTVVFVGIGAAATSVGGFLRENRSTFDTVAGILIIFFGLFIAVTAVWNPRILLPMMRERRVEVRPSRLGAMAPPVMGAAFAFGWTPCLGPVLGALLTLSASEETVGRGMLLLFSYSLGIGLPFLISALLMAKAFSFFAWIRRYLTPITVASGLLLAGFGVLVLTGEITTLSSWFTDLLVRLGLERFAVS